MFGRAIPIILILFRFGSVAIAPISSIFVTKTALRIKSPLCPMNTGLFLFCIRVSQLRRKNLFFFTPNPIGNVSFCFTPLRFDRVILWTARPTSSPILEPQNSSPDYLARKLWKIRSGRRTMGVNRVLRSVDPSDPIFPLTERTHGINFPINVSYFRNTD